MYRTHIDPSDNWLASKKINNELHLHCLWCDTTFGRHRFDLAILYKHAFGEKHLDEKSSRAPAVHVSESVPGSSPVSGSGSGSEAAAPSAEPPADPVANVPAEAASSSRVPLPLNLQARQARSSTMCGAGSSSMTSVPPASALPGSRPTTGAHSASSSSAGAPLAQGLSRGPSAQGAGQPNKRSRLTITIEQPTEHPVAREYIQSVLASKNPQLASQLAAQGTANIPRKYVAEYVRVARVLNLCWGVAYSRLSEAQAHDELCRHLASGADCSESGVSRGFLKMQISVFEAVILSQVGQRIEAADLFAISLDGSSGRISVRVVYIHGECVRSDCLGLYDCLKENAEALVMLLHSIFVIAAHLVGKLVALVTDGFSVNNRLAHLLAVPVVQWCLAHRLENTSSNCWKSQYMQDINKFFLSLAGFYKKSSAHAASLTMFVDLLCAADWHPNRMQCGGTRFNSRHKALVAFVDCLEAFVSELRTIIATDTSKKRRQWATRRLSQVTGDMLATVAIYADCSTLLQIAIERVQSTAGSLSAGMAAVRQFSISLCNYQYLVLHSFDTLRAQPDMAQPDLYISKLLHKVRSKPDVFTFTASYDSKKVHEAFQYAVSGELEAFCQERIHGRNVEIVTAFRTELAGYMQSVPVLLAWDNVSNLSSEPPTDYHPCPWVSDFVLLAESYNMSIAEGDQLDEGPTVWIHWKRVGHSLLVEGRFHSECAVWLHLRNTAPQPDESAPAADEVVRQLRFLVTANLLVLNNTASNERDFSVLRNYNCET